jgi:hypothetical protein
MRIQHACLVALLAACGGDSSKTDAGISDVANIDAPEIAPMITSFVATPSLVTSGVPTMITWTWSYANEPTLPDPTCTINNGVGAVTRGQMIEITLTAVTTFTLTCTNSAGTASRQVVVGVPPVAPVIATFTATPGTVTPNAAANVTWSWTYSNTPSPTPTCSIEHDVGTVTSGTTTSVTLGHARTYRLRCTNAAGSSFADASITIDECSAGLHDCQGNASCVETAESFTCQCNSGYTGNGDTCSALVNCGATPSLCDANASCVSGTSCVCNAGYTGDGTTCARHRFTFVTSATGTGAFSSWADANGNAGLAAADAICNARAAAASLPGTYVAWASDAISDAYCRVHGLTGKKSNNCGLGALPVAAGPWTRPSGVPVAPRIQHLLAPTRQTFAIPFSELNAEVTSSTLVYTGTDGAGVYTSTASCNDWTASSSFVRGTAGESHGGGTSWTDQGATDPTCNNFGRLRCVEVGAGPALPSRHPAAKRAFLTSVTGSGNLGTWSDAAGTTGITAADTICQARARFAGYSNAGNFKAWMSSGTAASTRILTNGPWVRPDGIQIGSSKADLTDGRLAAALYQLETGTYAAGNADMGTVWTGTSSAGSATFSYCSIWTTTASSATFGRHDLGDFRWVAATTQSCTAEARLYCVED